MKFRIRVFPVAYEWVCEVHIRDDKDPIYRASSIYRWRAIQKARNYAVDYGLQLKWEKDNASLSYEFEVDL